MSDLIHQILAWGHLRLGRHVSIVARIITLQKTVFIRRLHVTIVKGQGIWLKSAGLTEYTFFNKTK